MVCRGLVFCHYLYYTLKRILTITLLFVYVAITTGLVVEMHYCMGKRINGSVSLVRYHDDEHTCGKCGMVVADDSKCCHNEIAIIKVSDNHQPISYHFDIKPTIVTAFEFFAPQQNWAAYNNNNNRVFISSSPPGIQQVSLQALYSVFRI